MTSPMDAGSFLEKGFFMISSRTRQHIGNFFLDWIRRDSTQEALTMRTQREVRDELVRLVAVGGRQGMRIANQLTRWIFSGAEDVRDLRWREDIECRRRILKEIDRGLEKDGGELDEDITNDITAASYPRCFDRVRESMANAQAFLKNQQSLDRPAKEAETKLVGMLRGGLEDWELSI